MTAAQKRSGLGPLFMWGEQKGPEIPESRDLRDLSKSQGISAPEKQKDPGPDLKVPDRFGAPDLSSKKGNDSANTPHSRIPPLKGGEQTGSFSLGPHSSSAALELRSQRTELRGGEPAGAPGTDQKPTAAQGSEQPALSARPYQLGAIEAVEAQYRAGVKRTLVVLPTGTGKTIVLALLLLRYKLQAEGRRGRGLVLAHRTELIDQNAGKCRAVGLTTSIEKGDSRASRSSDVVVASVQTLQRARLAAFAHDEFDYIVIDEAHHAAAKTYQNILEHFPDALVLGLTATPMRLDGKPLGDTFQTTAYTYELRKAIADEWLVPIVARRVRITDVDMSAVKSAHGDLAQEELSLVMRDAKALQGVVGPTIALGGQRRAIVFAVDRAHAHALTELFNKHKPGSAIALDGTAPDAKRKAVLELFAKGTFQYLVNCELLLEGFDDPGIECVVMARPTMSVALYIQMLGRGTRLLGLSFAESCRRGKRDVLLLDCVGNTRHRLASPADALAGMKLPDAIVDEVNGALDSGKELSVELVLAEAEKKAADEIRRKAELALAHFRQTDVDPFIGHIMPPLDPSNPAFHKPATDAQIAAIEAKGLGTPPPGLTLGEASRLLDGLAERDRLGLATVSQCKLLRKFKLDCSTMTKKRASELFLKGKARGFSGEWIYRNEPEYRPGKKS